MQTLVLPPRYTEDSILLWRAALAAGWQVERLASWQAPPSPQQAEWVVYGEPLFAALVAETLGLSLLRPTPDWLAGLPYPYRQREIQYTILAEARTYPATAFIKPAEEKSFPAQVYTSGEMLPLEEVLPPTLPVLLSEPVIWEKEFRCFVLEGKVLTLSPYARAGAIAQNPDGTWPASPEEIAQVDEFARTLLADPAVRVPPAVVLDVGLIVGRGWAAVEVNPAFSSGIYGCDPHSVLRVLARGCVPAGGVTPDDEPWITLP